MENFNYNFKYSVEPNDVNNVLNQYMLADGYNFVLDLKMSHGLNFIEEKTGKRFVDFFTCFASLPIGMNHKKLTDESFKKYIANIAINKPSNSDIYTSAMATFVKTFFNIAVPKSFKYSFFIDGGALAVENALKTAFDWKVRKNFNNGYKFERGHQIIHFKQAFHGRSGYTMSITNTDPVKTMYFPKFDWPRITNPKILFPLDQNIDLIEKQEQIAIQEIHNALLQNKDDIAAIIIEPIQGEGGDNHFRTEFLQQLRTIADENEVLLIFDEVQTGVGITGEWWAHEALGVTPDIMVFGKKMQVCGIIATDRIDDVNDNVFHTSSRINSTWGGNLVDMVRATKYLEVIEEENMLSNVKHLGVKLEQMLQNITNEFPDKVHSPRGLGLFRAFDLANVEIRKEFLNRTWEEGLIILPCGETTIRFRPPLNITEKQLIEGVEIVKKVISEI